MLRTFSYNEFNDQQSEKLFLFSYPLFSLHFTPFFTKILGEIDFFLFSFAPIPQNMYTSPHRRIANDELTY